MLPVVSAYLGTLRDGLDAAGIKASLYLMQSNGGLTTADTAARLPMHIIESGPAGGVIGSQAIARAFGIDNVISFDMGGTTAKTSMISRGEVTRALDMQVGGGIIHGSRLLTGAGYALKVPAIDLAEVGAGGGSILWIDAGGSLQAGSAQRWRRAGSGVLQHRRRGADHHRCQPDPGVSQSGPPGGRGRCRLIAIGPPGRLKRRSRARWACRSRLPHTART